MTRTRKVNKNNKRNRASYSITQKNQVITYAKQHRQNKVADHFQLDANMIDHWLKANSFKTCGISNTLDDIGDSYKEIEGDLEITDISDLENDSDFENDMSDDNLEDN
ncbi:11341_t:CDS:2 [Funneliformis geosporum]|nr:11341_t:CDS:2 [Funneliformis geosporum]